MFGSKKDKDSAKEKALKRGVALGAMIAGLATATGVPALAQEAEEPETQAQQQDEADIVVTGSRIRRNEFTSSSPVQIITSEQNSLEGLIDTSEILQGSTIASGSQQINNQFTGFVVEGGPGVNTVSLRGLGANRTLVLLNGRRINPAGSRGQVGAVDTNVIPESMIERIEILKDGASSIYGSDAVAGVVNIITTSDLDGFVLEGTGSITEQGGGESLQINGSWGRVFDNGQFVIGAEYFKRESLGWGDREATSCAEDYVFEGGPGGDRIDIIDPLTGEPKCFNLLQDVIDARTSTAFGALGMRFAPDPSAVLNGGPLGLDRPGFRLVGQSYNNVNAICNGALNGGVALPCAANVEQTWRDLLAATPNDSPLYGSRDSVSPVERWTIFATGSLDISASAELYGEAMYNRRESSTNSLRQIFPTISGANPQVATSTFGNLGATARSIVQLPSITAQEIDFFRGVLGVRGDFGEGFLSNWSYDAYVQTGFSDATYGNNFFYNDRVLATTGAALCNPNPAGGNLSNFNCADVPNGVNYLDAIFGGFSSEEAAFLFDYEEGTTTYDQTIVSGLITGDVFDLPAGPLSLALGAEYRRESIDDKPGFNAQIGNLWGQTSAGRTVGTDEVRELFGEVEAPLIANAPMFENLTFNGSYRWTDYDSFGDDTTYKVGLNWQITPEYRLRATTGTSYRAPALFELFLANQTGFLGQAQIDPCIQWDSSTSPQIQANCGPGGVGLPPGYTGPYPSALIVTGGGAGTLQAETSEATTYGFVWTPSFINLSVAVDYFDIVVEDEVAQFGAAAILGACYTSPQYPNNSFCGLFTRDENPASPTFGQIQTVNNSYVNLDRQDTEGLDVTLRYEHEFSFGTFRADFQGTWTFEDSVLFAAGTPSEDLIDFNGEIVDPDFTANLNLRFDRNDFTYFWDVNMVGKASNTEEFGGDIFGFRAAAPYANNAYYKQYTEAYATHTASVRYQTDTWTLLGTVRNVFDEPPPVISTASFFARLGTFPLTNQYDLLGRTYVVSVARRW
ncbi:MAG: TonB-dependent receptor [Alphaproteobacteria bacterium]|nr:TonB-dependent receptor [Alphaproteobacteria bacterium]